VDDPRDDYGDPAPAWAAAPGPDPTGLRPCDRAHLAGWVGLFIALILLGIGIGYVRVLRGGPTAEDLMRLVPLGATVALYGFAGVCLILRTLTDRLPTGPLVLVCNLIVVGPILAVIGLFTFGALPAGIASFVTAFPALRTVGVYAGVFGLVFAAEVVILCSTRDGRRLLQVLWAWLDPTGGQW
jgi:hypothetical protein